MGLLDGMDLEDPKTQLLLQMGLGLLGGAPNGRKNFMADLSHAGQQGLMGYSNASQRKDKRAEDAQQRQMREMGMEQSRMQMEQSRRQMAEQGAMRGAASEAFRPGFEPQGPMPDGGNMPAVPGGGGMPDFAQRAMAINPLEGMKYMPKPTVPKFHTVGGALVQEPTEPGGQARPVFQAPKEPKDWQDPAYQDFMLKKAAAGASRVSVDTRQETEFAKKMGANYAENYQGILNSGFQSQAQMNSLNRFQNIVSQIPTGKLEPVKSEIAKLAASAGFKIDTEKLSFQESLDALANEFALTLRNPAGGAGMPGALSDKDREFLVSMVPGLGKTPGGNMMIIEARKRVAQREAEVAKLARAYKARTGKFDEGFYEVLAQEFGSKDILGDLHAKVAGMPQAGTTLRFDRNGKQL